MGALLGFLPFIVFALAEKAMGIVPALAAGALVSIALLVRARMHGAREINILEAGSALVFAALTLLAWVWGDASGAWSVWLVRLWVDGGLLISVLLGLALRRPFTLQYARQQVSPEIALKTALPSHQQHPFGGLGLCLRGAGWHRLTYGAEAEHEFVDRSGAHRGRTGGGSVRHALVSNYFAQGVTPWTS